MGKSGFGLYGVVGGMTVILDVKSKMIVVRGQSVLIDRDVATLYGVETRALNQAVKRNPDRFPERDIYLP